MEYDIFISYSHRDNLVLEGKSHGWIARFHVALDYHLTNFLGRKPNIFRDVKIEGYQRITPSVYAALDRSLLFLPVLSPNFLTSEWCPDELDYFFDRVKSKDANRQVFSVVKTPIETVPDKLKDHLLKFEYFQEGNLESEPLLQFNPDFGEELGNRFHLKTSDLARRMASYIKGVSKKGVVSNPPANDECIYLAEPSPDLW